MQNKIVQTTDKKLINQTIVDVIDIFRVTNKSLSHANITEREAVKALINLYGIENTIESAKYAVMVQTEPYAPVITKPLILLKKFTELWIFYKRQTKQKNNIVFG